MIKTTIPLSSSVSLTTISLTTTITIQSIRESSISIIKLFPLRMLSTKILRDIDTRLETTMPTTFQYTISILTLTISFVPT